MFLGELLARAKQTINDHRVIIDAHIHCSGAETATVVLKSLDQARVDAAILLAPFLTAPFKLSDNASLRDANAHLGRLVRDHGDRLFGFAVVNPLHAGAVDDLERAVGEHGLRGLKLVPSGWYPDDDRAHRVYERANRLGLPVLFHSGIFIDGRSGKYCRPVFYEAVREHPGLRVALAHLGWPWTDEANAVGLIDLIHGVDPVDCQFRFDFSFGAPPIYRKMMLERALAVLGPQLLQFGSDRFLPCAGSHIRDMIDEVTTLFDELAVSEVDRRQMMGLTAASWLGCIKA